jgi:hypothetical protein
VLAHSSERSEDGSSVTLVRSARGGCWRRGWRACEWLGRGGAATYAGTGATWRRIRERRGKTGAHESGNGVEEKKPCRVMT